ncbi:MAG: 50S ribosomal protein L35 [Anaerolineales bacterium]
MAPRKKSKKKRKKKYKLKTHKATAKRFRKTGSGKILRTKGHQSHLKRRKSNRAKRAMQRMHEVVAAGLKRRIRRLAPYLGR